MPDGYSCLPSNPCPINNGGCEHICRFTGVSRECSCRSGYELASDGTSCVEDADLCASNGGRGDCEHTCTSISGSRVCSCSTGYQLLTDGVSCEGERTQHYSIIFVCLFMRYYHDFILL